MKKEVEEREETKKQCGNEEQEWRGEGFEYRALGELSSTTSGAPPVGAPICEARVLRSDSLRQKDSAKLRRPILVL